MNQDQLKQQVAKAALQYIPEDCLIGVGTGSTVNFFIEALATVKHKVEGAVSSSHATTERLQQYGIPVVDISSITHLDVYVDGADEANPYRQLIKGGGGALTGEKIVAALSKQFVCIIDKSKQVRVLGDFPLPIEVIPMARSFVAREIVKMGGDPVYRENFVTDHGNIILDIFNFQIAEPIKMEQKLNQIPGVVCNGLFADKPADMILIASEQGIETLK